MEVTIDRKKLAQELRLLAAVSERRSTIPVLTHILVTARDGRLRLAATDLDVSLTVDLEAEVAGAGGVSVHARKLHAVVKSLRSETVTLSTEGDTRLVVAGGGARITLHGKPEEEWPTTATAPAKVTASFDAAELLLSIRRVLFAVSDEDSRFQLNAARLETGKASTCLAATDGHRLSVVKMTKTGRKSAALVPRDALTALLLFKAEAIDYTAGEHHVAFRTEGRELIARICEGEFPRYQKLLDDFGSTADKTVVIDRRLLLDALATLKPMLGGRTRAVVITGGGNGHLTMKATDHDLGEATVEVPVEWSGRALTVGVNSDYLADWSKSLGVDRVRLRMGDEHHGILGYAVGDGSAEYLVMPMKI